MRIALALSYLGTPYHGWQTQPSGRAVQDHVERALLKFSGHPLTAHCAGRTDAGVHALMQVVHVDSPVQRTAAAWVRGVNSFLPADIGVQWAQPMADGFHARSSASARRYSYLLLQSPVRPSVDAHRVGWTFRSLDGAAMQQAADILLGTHDFTSFRASACQALTPVKHMMRIGVQRHGSYWRFDFEANAFLHHMIRNIMGCLVAIGAGQHPPNWMHAVLQARSRAAAAPTFAPDGLYFLGPRYDAHWGLPTRTPAFDWLPGDFPP